MPRAKWGYQYVVSMASDPVETDRVYAAVGAYTNGWDPNNGAILYSDDRGETWGIAELPFKQGGNMPGRGMGERLAVNPANNAELYLGTPNGNGLWRSKDYGRTWAAVENFPNPGNFVIEPGNIILGDNQGVIWIDFDQIGGKIYVGVADPADPLYVSEDGGATWQAFPGAAEALGAVDGNRTFPNQSAVDRHQRIPVHRHLQRPGPWQRSARLGQRREDHAARDADRRMDRCHPALQPARRDPRLRRHHRRPPEPRHDHDGHAQQLVARRSLLPVHRLRRRPGRSAGTTPKARTATTGSTWTSRAAHG